MIPCYDCTDQPLRPPLRISPVRSYSDCLIPLMWFCRRLLMLVGMAAVAVAVVVTVL